MNIVFAGTIKAEVCFKQKGFYWFLVKQKGFGDLKKYFSPIKILFRDKDRRCRKLHRLYDPLRLINNISWCHTQPMESFYFPIGSKRAI